MGLCEGLPIIIAEGAKVLILGSMPGNVSLAKGEYYGNRNNHFWSVDVNEKSGHLLVRN